MIVVILCDLAADISRVRYARRLNEKGTLLIIITRRNLMNRILIQAWWEANMYAPAQIRASLTDIGLIDFKQLWFPFPFWHLNLWGLAIIGRHF